MAERLKAVYDLEDGDPAWMIAGITTVATAGLEAKLDSSVAVVARASATIPESMVSASTEIVHGLADDITDKVVKKSVEAIKVAVSGEIVQIVRDAKSSLETIASQHRDSMTEKANKFGSSAESAVSKLVVAGVDVRNHGAKIAQLHLSHVIARIAWAFGGMVLAGIITFAGSRFFFHVQCVQHIVHVHAYHSLAQANALIGAYCP
ncbi:MAG: hypothetical protein ACYDA1_04825 [Vulcanimicrobiaceae bacterium]